MKVPIDTNITRNGCNALATRNKADYGDRSNVLDPTELVERLNRAARKRKAKRRKTPISSST